MIARFKISLLCAFGWGKTQTEVSTLTFTNEVKTALRQGTIDIIVSGTLMDSTSDIGDPIAANCNIYEDGVQIEFQYYEGINGDPTGNITFTDVTIDPSKYYNLLWSLV